jgi:hypothetical protein
MPRGTSGLLTMVGLAIGGYVLYNAFTKEPLPQATGPTPYDGPLPDDPRQTPPMSHDQGEFEQYSTESSTNLKMAMLGDPEYIVNPNKGRLNLWDWNYYYGRATGKEIDIHLGAFQHSDGTPMTVPEIQATPISWDEWYNLARTRAVSGGLGGISSVQYTYPGADGQRPGTLETARGYERAGFSRSY